jgi:hypothetical protein
MDAVPIQNGHVNPSSEYVEEAQRDVYLSGSHRESMNCMLQWQMERDAEMQRVQRRVSSAFSQPNTEGRGCEGNDGEHARARQYLRAVKSPSIVMFLVA